MFAQEDRSRGWPAKAHGEPSSTGKAERLTPQDRGHLEGPRVVVKGATTRPAEVSDRRPCRVAKRPAELHSGLALDADGRRVNRYTTTEAKVYVWPGHPVA